MFDVDANGLKIPALGYGTFKVKGEGSRAIVEQALAVGYRHLDTAQIYDNEADVGAAIAAAGLPRDELFVTTKVWPDNTHPDRMLASVEESLRKLRLDRVDLLLIHWPKFETTLEEAVEQLVAAREKGYTRGIGISNFNREQVDRAAAASGGTLATNQVEYHPFIDQTPLLETLRRHKMALTAYSPLAQGRIVDEPTISSIADLRKITPAQVTLRWLIQQPGVIAIPKASGEERMRGNLDVFSFELTDDEMHAINRIGSPTGRLVSPADLAPDWTK
ncbi:aldo/keto reductase [Chthonobacter rhizosphaerae]|uniref:aldo/keto reductase n=1 Tax=Chthonobacter rhizosphaerae TaxID=2735553 RepID=UPI0015EEDB83|nr:aldo/keto reductase [Chthonobacter rhizosphaerae]